jgi:hypothetical protein
VEVLTKLMDRYPLQRIAERAGLIRRRAQLGEESERGAGKG